MPTTFKTTEERAADLVFDFINENQPNFDVQKFVAALRERLIREHQYVVRCPGDYTPEEQDFWADISYAIKGRL